MNELYHYGKPRRSGRYPWGSGENPYQGERRAKGLTGKIQTRRAEKKMKEMEKKRDELLKQAKAREEQTRWRAENKERVIRSGGVKEVSMYKGELTNREYEEIFKRFDYETRLAAMSPSEFTKNMKKMDNFMKNLRLIQQWTDIGTDLWNSMARIYNTTDQGREQPLRLVNKGNPMQPTQDKGSQNKNKNKKED